MSGFAFRRQKVRLKYPTFIRGQERLPKELESGSLEMDGVLFGVRVR
jgi:hypothetical protein